MDTLDVAVQAVESGLAAQANPSTDGSRQGLWPTATAVNRVRNEETMAKCAAFRKRNANQNTVPVYLEEKVLMEQKAWATPIVGDSHLASTPEVAAKRLEEGKVTLSRQNAGKLNPRWVETLMGLPVGWTMPSCACPVTIEPMNCDSLATESSRQPQNELFAP